MINHEIETTNPQLINHELLKDILSTDERVLSMVAMTADCSPDIFPEILDNYQRWKKDSNDNNDLARQVAILVTQVSELIQDKKEKDIAIAELKQDKQAKDIIIEEFKQDKQAKDAKIKELSRDKQAKDIIIEELSGEIQQINSAAQTQRQNDLEKMQDMQRTVNEHARTIKKNVEQTGKIIQGGSVLIGALLCATNPITNIAWGVFKAVTVFETINTVCKTESCKKEGEIDYSYILNPVKIATIEQGCFGRNRSTTEREYT